MKNKKVLSTAALVLISAIALSLCSCLDYFKWSKDEIDAVDSPTGKYTVHAYLCNGGATTDWLIECFVVNNENGTERQIYHQYHENEAKIEWVSDDEVEINGIKLNVETDFYKNNDYNH